MVFSPLKNLATGGTLNYWYSNKDNVYRFHVKPKVWTKRYINGFSQSVFDAYVNHAKTEWSNIGGFPVDSTTDENAASIKIYSGSYSELKPKFQNLLTTFGGVTIFPESSFEGDWIYANGSTFKAVYKLEKSEFCIVNKGNSVTEFEYKNVITHEYGHALGWDGHSSNSLDVMYDTAIAGAPGYLITSRDKNHIYQLKAY